MKSKSVLNKTSALVVLGMIAFLVPAAAQPVSYYIYGRAYGLHQSTEQVVSTFTSAIPGVTPVDPEPVVSTSPRVFLPGVSIEIYEVSTAERIGTGQANRDGYYNVSYMHVEENHEVWFQVYLDLVDGTREFVGETEPLVVDDRLFSLELEVPTDEAIKAGTVGFSPLGEYLFVEVGDVDMDFIYDEEQDPADPTRWGLTKPPAVGLGHTLGPDWAFGGSLELYGLFGETGGARYYRINYTGPASGSISSTLKKKSYVIAGTAVEIYETVLGPVDVGPLTGVYTLDEFLDGAPIPGHPGKFYSSYWTELGLRAIWNTSGLPDGMYTLSVESWDAAFTPLPAAANNFATLSLHLVNEIPQVDIHRIQYLDGSDVVTDVNPCQIAVLNGLTATPLDDNLQFEITARMPTARFPDPANPLHNGLRQYQLFAWHGHNDPDGEIVQDTYPFSSPPPNTGIAVTPGTITYQDCAYRFRLRAWPRVTNGYYGIHAREDNWYVSIDVVP